MILQHVKIKQPVSADTIQFNLLNLNQTNSSQELMNN